MLIKDLAINLEYNNKNVSALRYKTDDQENPNVITNWHLVLDEQTIPDDAWCTNFSDVNDKLIEAYKKNASRKILHTSKDPDLMKLIAQILRGANCIRTGTRRSAANYFLYNDAFEQVLNNTPYTDSATNETVMGISNNPMFSFSNNELTICSCIKGTKVNLHEDKPTCLLAFNGTNEHDGGIVYVTDPVNNRYAIIDSFINTKDYYYMIQIDDNGEF